MKKFAMAALAAGTILSSFAGSATAGEPVDGPSGFLCGFSSLSNPTAEAGTQTGEIDGGPLAIVDAEGNVGSGTLTCTIQVNQGTHDGSGVAVSASGTGVVAFGPTVVSYQADDDDIVFLCSEFTYANGGPTLYFHSSEDPTVEGHWSTASTSACAQATSANSGDVLEPIRPIEELVDSLICPVLAVVFPPTGDIPGVWDCPPYGV